MVESSSRDHLLQFDHSPDQDCRTVLPVQLLYDDGYEGIVAGFVWQHFVMIDTLARWIVIWSLEVLTKLREHFYNI